MRAKTLFAVGLIVALAVLATACGGGSAAPTKAPSATPTKTGGAPAGELITVKLTENPYGFVPTTFTFEAGKTYALKFEAPKEFHTFTVKELGIDVFINAGETAQQTITPTTKGTFKVDCTPHSTLGMVGTVTVK